MKYRYINIRKKIIFLIIFSILLNFFFIFAKATESESNSYKNSNINNVLLSDEFKSNSYLSSISVGNVEVLPNFSPDITNYNISVDYDTEQINIGANAYNKFATISGDIGLKKLNFGDNHFYINVNSQDLLTNTIYKITINRKVDLVDNDLSNLSIIVNGNNYDVSPVFSRNIQNYSATVAENIESIIINPSIANEDVEITGDIGIQNLKPGENNFLINVTDKLRTGYKTYNIKIIRLSSTDATLKNIYITGIGKSNYNLDFAPTFDPNVEIYNSKAVNTVKKIKITAETTNPNANIRVEDLQEKDLVLGENIFEILVTAEDNLTTKSYYININKSQVVEDIKIENIPTSGILELELGKDLSLLVSFIPDNSFDYLTFTSQDQTVAQIDKYGKIKPISVGQTNINIINESANINKNFIINITPIIANDSNSSEKNPVTSVYDIFIIPSMVMFMFITTGILILFRKYQLDNFYAKYFNRSNFS